MLLRLDELEIINKSLPKAEGKMTRKQAKEAAKKHYPDLPPNGRWVTIRGNHVYIVDGKVVAGFLPFVGKDGKLKPKKATKNHLKMFQEHIDKKAADKKAATKSKKTATKKTAEFEEAVPSKRLVQNRSAKPLEQMNYDELKTHNPSQKELENFHRDWYKKNAHIFGDVWKDRNMMKEFAKYTHQHLQKVLNHPDQKAVQSAIRNVEKKFGDNYAGLLPNIAHVADQLPDVKPKKEAKKAAPKKKSSEAKPKATKTKKAETKAEELPKPQQEYAHEWSNIKGIRIKAKQVGSYAVNGTTIKRPKDLLTMFADLANEDREKMYVVATKGDKVIGTQCVHVGSNSEVLAEPRHFLKLPILSGADGFYILHNHPQGESTPSTGDVAVTFRAMTASSGVGLQFKGHAIISERDCTFFDPETGEEKVYKTPKAPSKRTEHIPIYDTSQERGKDFNYDIRLSNPETAWKYAMNLGIRNGKKAAYAIGIDAGARVTCAIPLDTTMDDDELVQHVYKNLIGSNSQYFYLCTNEHGRYAEKLRNAGFRSMGEEDSMNLKLLDVVGRNPHTNRYYSIRENENFEEAVKSFVLYVLR